VIAGEDVLPNPTSSVVLRREIAEYGRPPRGRPLWQAVILLTMACVLILIFRAGWVSPADEINISRPR